MDIDTSTILFMVAKEFGLNRKSLEQRIRLQKTIYLLQVHGVKLAYGFSWYKYGPYSLDLVKDAYVALRAKKEEYEGITRRLRFGEDTKRKFTSFRRICGETLGNAAELELVASVDYARAQLVKEGTNEQFRKAFRQYKKQLFNGQEIDDTMINRGLRLSDRIRNNNT